MPGHGRASREGRGVSLLRGSADARYGAFPGDEHGRRGVSLDGSSGVYPGVLRCASRGVRDGWRGVSPGGFGGSNGAFLGDSDDLRGAFPDDSSGVSPGDLGGACLGGSGD